LCSTTLIASPLHPSLACRRHPSTPHPGAPPGALCGITLPQGSIEETRGRYRSTHDRSGHALRRTACLTFHGSRLRRAAYPLGRFSARINALSIQLQLALPSQSDSLKQHPPAPERRALACASSSSSSPSAARHPSSPLKRSTPSHPIPQPLSVSKPAPGQRTGSRTARGGDAPRDHRVRRYLVVQSHLQRFNGIPGEGLFVHAAHFLNGRSGAKRRHGLVDDPARNRARDRRHEK